MKLALINNTIASLKKEPTWECELIDEALYGMKVEITQDAVEGWYLIKTPYQYTGYVHESELLFDKVRINEWDNSEKLVVCHNYADVLSMPKVQGIHRISLTRGAIVVASDIADDNGWVTVKLCDGRIGYIKEKFVSKYLYERTCHDEASFRKAVVNTALSYLGTQYRWGGKSPLGIDCSGLCQMAYLLNGVTIYRDARIEEGFPIHEISYEDKKPGDLLFFPGHVAMYIGRDKYIHSTGMNGSDGVVINSLNPKDDDYREDLPKIQKAVGSLF